MKAKDVSDVQSYTKNSKWEDNGRIFRRGFREGEMGEFSPPPLFLSPPEGTIDHFLGSKYRRGH